MGCTRALRLRTGRLIRPDAVVKAIGSGLHGHRRRWRLVADPTVGTIVVEHRECLTRFGFG